MDATSPAITAPQRSVNRTIISMLPPQLALAMIWMGVLQVLLPTQVAALDAAHKVENLGLVTGLGAIFGAVCNPLGGALSDRTRSRFGRRAPWLVGTAVATLAAMLLMGQASSLVPLGITFCLVQCTTSGFQAVLSAVMPERVPVHRRGLASSVIGMGLPLGAVVGTAVASRFLGDIAAGYLLLGAFLLVCGLGFVALGGDTAQPLTRVPRGSVSLPRGLASFFSVMSAADFRWTFISRFLCLLAFSLPAGFGLYLLQDHIRLGEGHAAAGVLVTINVVQMACMTVSTLLAGPLSDWLGGRRRVFVWCAASGMAAALTIPLLMPTEIGMYLFAACNGLAFGVYLAVDAALVTQVLPDEKNVARDLGILNIANAGPQIIAPFVGSQVIAWLGGYNALFVAAAVCAVASALAILPVRGVR
jgi:MFS family permease